MTGAQRLLADRYELQMLIGKGGMAKIYLARDLNEERAVVIKMLRARDLAATSELQRGMFEHEARVTTLLEHPNIIRMYDLGIEGDYCYIVMEWLIGWDLAQIQACLRATQKPMPLPILLRLMSDACAGLAAAHACRNQAGEPIHLIHRDISPSNLFVTVAGTMKLIDFGVAKSALQLQHTRPGVIKGKLAYLSPEQIRCEQLDPRTDIFSLGIVFYELVANRALFPESEPDACMDAILHAPITPPQRLREPLAKELQAVIMRSLQRDRDLRHQTVDQLRDALLAAAEKHGRLAPREVVTQYLCYLNTDEPTAPSLGSAERIRLQRGFDEIIDGGFAAAPTCASAPVEKNRLSQDTTVTDGDRQQAMGENDTLPQPSPESGSDTRQDFFQLELPDTLSAPRPHTLTSSFLRLNARHSLGLLGIGLLVAALFGLARHWLADDPRQTAGPIASSVHPTFTSTEPSHASREPSNQTPHSAGDVHTAVSELAVRFSPPEHSGRAIYEHQAKPVLVRAPRRLSPLTPESTGDVDASPGVDQRESKPALRGKAPHRSKSGRTRRAHEKETRPRATRKENRTEKARPRSGLLTLEAQPWARVYLEGKYLGVTPLVRRHVPAGKIRLRLVNPEAGIEREFQFLVPAGTTVRRTVSLN